VSLVVQTQLLIRNDPLAIRLPLPNRMSARFFTAARTTTAVLLAVSAAGLNASDHKLSPELANVAPNASVDVIVKYRQAPTPAISSDDPVYAMWKPVSPVIYTGSPDYGWKTVGADLAKTVFSVDGTGGDN
jgi:hypothetical protein